MNTVEVNLRKRNSSIELLRIVAMVTIVYFHFHARDFSLYVLGNERIQEKGVFLHTVLHHLGMLGVPCFMFVSGYYGIKFRECRFVDIIFQCLFYTLLTFAGCYAFCGYCNIQQLFFFNNWWFVLAYVVIYMLSSGLNYIIEILSAKKMLIMIILFYFMMMGSMFNKAATPLLFKRRKDSKYSDYLVKDFIIGVFEGTDIEIVFKHYHSEKEVREKWYRRLQRLDTKNMIVKFSDSDLCTEDLIRRFDVLPFKNKICFTGKPYPKYKSVKYMSEFKESGHVVNEWAYSYNYYNFVREANKVQ